MRTYTAAEVLAFRAKMIDRITLSIAGTANPRKAAEYVVNRLTVHERDLLAEAAATFAPPPDPGPFLLFAGPRWYPFGGGSDFLGGPFATVEEAAAHLPDPLTVDGGCEAWAHAFDMSNGSVVAQWEYVDRLRVPAATATWTPVEVAT